MEVFQASLMGVIRILLWLFLISIVIRLVARMALPVVMKKADEAMRQRAAQHRSAAQPPRKEGEVTVERDLNATKSAGGEYVDFVEIKE
jgi:hypothetical protein